MNYEVKVIKYWLNTLVISYYLLLRAFVVEEKMMLPIYLKIYLLTELLMDVVD